MTEKFVTLPREVLEQVLNALDAGVKISPNSVLHDRLRAALEQPQVEQEPVTTLTIEVEGPMHKVDFEWGDPLRHLPAGSYELYLHPQPKREPLTDEAVLGVAKSIEIQFDSERLNEQIDDILAFARAIEAAHNIK